MQTLSKPTPLSHLYQQVRYRWPPRFTIGLLILISIFWFLARRNPSHSTNLTSGNKETPLVTKYFLEAKGDGGRWYIPDEWSVARTDAGKLDAQSQTQSDIPEVTTPAEAAQVALMLCMRHNRYLEYSKIPLIIHQTWKDTAAGSWSQLARNGVEDWLRVATGALYQGHPKMAYIFWDDQAIDSFISLYEPDMWENFRKLPHPVEKADIFRVAVVKWFGGVYADIDAQPLQHPYKWIQRGDLQRWTDQPGTRTYYLHKPNTSSYEAPEGAPSWPQTKTQLDDGELYFSYNSSMALYAPKSVDVAAIFGIEADTPVTSDAYWRSGYAFPVQVTNWALASAPHHPVTNSYISRTSDQMSANMSRITKVDPLDLTGPPALTAAIKSWSESEEQRFTWESVSGLYNAKGGRGKIIIGDVLILPITGFSPGRGSFHNMGSLPLDHPNARLAHVAQGSWRHSSLRVEAGKLCRTLLGACREWSKVP